MTFRLILIVVVAVAALGLGACNNHHSKFQLGDHVIRKLTGEKAIVVARLRPFADDIYWVKMPGGESDRDGALAVPGEYAKYDSHLVAPFYEDDLVLGDN